MPNNWRKRKFFYDTFQTFSFLKKKNKKNIWGLKRVAVNCHCLPTPPHRVLFYFVLYNVPLEEEKRTHALRGFIWKERPTERPTHFSFLTVSFYGGVGVIVRLGFTRRRRRKNWFLRVEEYIFRTPLSPPVSLLTPRRTLYTWHSIHPPSASSSSSC
jgi:hypothetical protein